MTAVIETTRLSKYYPKGVRALDGVSVALERNGIHGLLGRNGAGKTTLMQLLTGQLVATSGDMRVLGGHPFENADVLSRTCFVQESQRYPDGYRARDIFSIARRMHDGWDADLERRLVGDFRLPLDREIKKLSRGQHSAMGIVLGLASRAEVTFFDEPYLGLDAVARQLFYDHLLDDFAEQPRTILLSTHLIDEVANLLEHVIVLDEGRVLIDANAEELRGRAYDVSGRADAVERFTADREVVAQQRIGDLANATVLGALDVAARDELATANLTTSSVSLQSLIVHLTRPPDLAAAGGDQSQLADMQRSMIWNGAVFAMLGPLMGLGFTAMLQMFPLALGLGITRREFAVGSLAVFAGLSMLFAVTVTILRVVERATNGFGLRIRMFDVIYVGTGDWWHTLAHTFTMLFMAMLVSAALSTIYLRGGQPALWLVITCFVLAGGITVAIAPAGLPGVAKAVAEMTWSGCVLGFVLVAAVAALTWALLLRRAPVR